MPKDSPITIKADSLPLFMDGSDGSLWPVHATEWPPPYPKEELYLKASDLENLLKKFNITIK